MKNKKITNVYKVLGLILIGVIFLRFEVKAFLVKNIGSKMKLSDISNLSVKTASAQEIYPMFECPCCGKAIEECTCPMAKERRAFVDGLTAGEISEDEAIMAYAKNYGLESFMDENKQADFKQKLIAQAPADRPIVAISSDSFDFGDISQKEGVKSTLFELKNEGKSDLVINRLDASCGCTSAAIVYQDQEGPKFSMSGHGTNEAIEGWQVTISPGDTAQIKVYYDPDVHQDFRGTATRTVSVFSNDPIAFEKKVTIELNQVD